MKSIPTVRNATLKIYSRKPMECPSFEIVQNERETPIGLHESCLKVGRKGSL